MTICGYSKYGFSTYYIKFPHGKIVFDQMLDMIWQMVLNGSSSIDIIGFRKSRKKQWHDRYEFLTCKYGKHHLKQLDMDRLHCCMFALGGNCEHSHKESSCIKCLTCFSFFKRIVLPFLENVNEEFF